METLKSELKEKTEELQIAESRLQGQFSNTDLVPRPQKDSLDAGENREISVSASRKPLFLENDMGFFMMLD